MKKITFLLFALASFTWQANAQDTCGTATPVTPGTITGTVITIGTGSAEMAPSGADSAWFVYSATADGTIDVSSCGGGDDTDLSIGTGTCGALTGAINVDDSCDLGNGQGYASEITDYPVLAGNDYYIEWSNEWSEGPFDWTLSFTPPPMCTPTVSNSETVMPDCGMSEFSIDVDIASVGDGTFITDGLGGMFAVVAGTVTAGPYADGSSVTLTVEHSDGACDFSLGSFSNTCPPACGSNFYDTGGVAAPYASNENVTTTICPDVPGDLVNVTFTLFNIENNASGCWDGLTIHDGADATAPTINPAAGTIWCWDRNVGSEGGSGDLQGMTITSSDASGCLTFVFTSDSSVTRPGWEATIGCAPLSLEDYGLTGFTYFPNPVNNSLSLRGVNTIQNVAIYNMLGQEVIRTSPNTLNSEIDMSNLQPGTYFVKVMVDNATKTIKVIKQ